MSETVLTDTFFTNFELHPLLQQGQGFVLQRAT